MRVGNEALPSFLFSISSFLFPRQSPRRGLSAHCSTAGCGERSLRERRREVDAYARQRGQLDNGIAAVARLGVATVRLSPPDGEHTVVGMQPPDREVAPFAVAGKLRLDV